MIPLHLSVKSFKRDKYLLVVYLKGQKERRGMRQGREGSQWSVGYPRGEETNLVGEPWETWDMHLRETWPVCKERSQGIYTTILSAIAWGLLWGVMSMWASLACHELALNIFPRQLSGQEIQMLSPLQISVCFPPPPSYLIEEKKKKKKKKRGKRRGRKFTKKNRGKRREIFLISLFFSTYYV